MRREINSAVIYVIIIVFVHFVAGSVFSQQDKLVGRWEGKVKSAQGERETSLVIKNEGGVYTGVMPSMRQGMDVQLKDFKIDGDKVTARADIETPQGASISINYSFTLAGDTLNGQGSLTVGGNNITFDIELKRANANPDAGGQAEKTGQQARRVETAQPQQKQSIDYFAGDWNYKYIGRESALWPAPRECVVSLSKRADGKSVEGDSACKYEGGAFKDHLLIVFDESAMSLGFTETLGSGATVKSVGDWSSPISIRFTIDPVSNNGQKLQLKRAISIISASSFTETEELSEDGGPFVRLGRAVFSKAVAK